VGRRVVGTGSDGNVRYGAPQLILQHDGRFSRNRDGWIPVVWEDGETPKPWGANVRDALVHSGGYAGVSSFDWGYTLSALVEGLNLATWRSTRSRLFAL
jgi:hypothetical protein